MVSYKQVQASNALVNDATAPRVSVFVGGTSGVGNATVRALAATGASLRIYLVGRKSSEERMLAMIKDLHAINPRAEIIWTEGEVSLLADSKRVCDIIRSKESRIDLLFLTAGYGPYGKRNETSEGLEISQTLSYYSRILFVLHLLPLLREAEAPKVITVLSGDRVGPWMAASIDADDLQLKNPKRFGGVNGQILYGAMNTMTLERLACENPGVTFLHSSPGLINTGNVWRGLNPNSVWAWTVWLLLDPLIRMFAVKEEASGQRLLFQSTSAAFGGHGVPWNGQLGVNSFGKKENGLYLVSYMCEPSANAKGLSLLRERLQGKIWDHTQEILGPYL